MIKKKAVKKTKKAQPVKAVEVEPVKVPEVEPVPCWVDNCTSVPPCTKHGPKPAEVDNG